MRARDHCEPERVGHPLAVRLALGREAEHRLDERLELERGAYLADEAGLAVAGVPEAVRRAGLDRKDVARLRHDLLVADPEAEPALEHLEALGLVRVHVRRGDEPVGADDRLDEDGLAVGLAGRLVKDEDLAGYGVLEPVSLANHLLSFRARLQSGQPGPGAPFRRRPVA